MLVTELQTACDSSVEQTKKDKKPKTLPAALVRSMERMKVECSALTVILSPQTEGDTKAKRKADRIIDNAWAAFHGWVNGWCLLPPEKNPHADETAALYDLMFSKGLDFTQLAYKIEWQQSQSRLDAIERDGYAKIIHALGGKVFLDHLTEAQATYGKVLNITTPHPEQTDEDIRTKLLATMDAIRDYVKRAASLADPDEPGSQELSEKLLRPLMVWETRTTGETETETEEAIPPAAPAVPPAAENPK